ncbi:MAG: nicotinate (nicotinamide) nucleotide adenylyltransferase [Clostridia bacterium]|nr:nicotinate (nicotinamide) nucleotide adenylyltransferase [Clostridia bacterium]
MADKIAIFGGSFNPIHNGHIRVAEYALKECGLSKIIFLPNATPPHKNKAEIISAEHRFNMVALAIENNISFEISDYEMILDAPSYTINTIRHFKKLYGADIFFIIGADSLYTLNQWKQYNDLVNECFFIVADRNSTHGSNLLKEAQNHQKKGGKIKLIKMPKIDITSSFIRDKLSKGEDVSKYLPEKVNDYIIKNGLYKNNPEE